MSAERADAHETITLSRRGVKVYFHRYGCKECHHGVLRVVVDIDGEHNIDVLGKGAELLWEMADHFDVERAIARRGRT